MSTLALDPADTGEIRTDIGNLTRNLAAFLHGPDPDNPPKGYRGKHRAKRGQHRDAPSAGGKFFLVLAAIPTIGAALGLIMVGVI